MQNKQHLDLDEMLAGIGDSDVDHAGSQDLSDLLSTDSEHKPEKPSSSTKTPSLSSKPQPPIDGKGDDQSEGWQLPSKGIKRKLSPVPAKASAAEKATGNETKTKKDKSKKKDCEGDKHKKKKKDKKSRA